MIYLGHFGLSHTPFSLTPRTGLFYPAAAMTNALAALQNLLAGGCGIVKVTGEVGTGKTLLCRLLLESLPEATALAYIAVPPQCDSSHLLAMVASEFGLAVPPGVSPLSALQTHLLALHETGQTAVLVIDEAQVLGANGLETIRLLSNLENGERSLLQIMLFAQPELDCLLTQASLRQLRQRIAYALETKPLSMADSMAYTGFRLRHAQGGRQDPLISGVALRLLAIASRGVPRLLNILADRALLAAYADDAPVAGWRHALTAMLEQSRLSQRLAHKLRRGLSFGGAALAAWCLYLSLGESAGLSW